LFDDRLRRFPGFKINVTDKLLRWSPFAACLYAYVLIGGIVSLAGWILDMPRLTDWYDYGISAVA
jgi:hypothetical protein